MFLRNIFCAVGNVESFFTEGDPSTFENGFLIKRYN